MKEGVLGKMKEGRGDVKKGVDAKRKEEGTRGVNWATLYMNVSLRILAMDISAHGPIE